MSVTTRIYQTTQCLNPAALIFHSRDCVSYLYKIIIWCVFTHLSVTHLKRTDGVKTWHSLSSYMKLLPRTLRILSLELDIKHVGFRSRPWHIVYNAPQFLPSDSETVLDIRTWTIPSLPSSFLRSIITLQIVKSKELRSAKRTIMSLVLLLLLFKPQSGACRLKCFRNTSNCYIQLHFTH